MVTLLAPFLGLLGALGSRLATILVHTVAFSYYFQHPVKGKARSTNTLAHQHIGTCFAYCERTQRRVYPETLRLSLHAQRRRNVGAAKAGSAGPSILDAQIPPMCSCSPPAVRLMVKPLE